MPKATNRRAQTAKRYTPAEIAKVQELRRSGASGFHAVKTERRKPKHPGRGWDND